MPLTKMSLRDRHARTASPETASHPHRPPAAAIGVDSFAAWNLSRPPSPGRPGGLRGRRHCRRNNLLSRPSLRTSRPPATWPWACSSTWRSRWNCEHLPRRGSRVCAWLPPCRMSSVSASTPRQVGKNHFTSMAGHCRPLRHRNTSHRLHPTGSNDRNIATWYRQNLLVYVRRSRLADLRLPEPSRDPFDDPPEVFIAKLDRRNLFRC